MRLICVYWELRCLIFNNLQCCSLIYLSLDGRSKYAKRLSPFLHLLAIAIRYFIYLPVLVWRKRAL